MLTMYPVQFLLGFASALLKPPKHQNWAFLIQDSIFLSPWPLPNKDDSYIKFLTQAGYYWANSDRKRQPWEISCSLSRATRTKENPPNSYISTTTIDNLYNHQSSKQQHMHCNTYSIFEMHGKQT